MNMKRRQSGYQLEVLIIVAVVMVLLAVGLPRLAPLGQKIAAVAGAIVLIAGFGPPWSWVAFAIVAAFIAAAAGAFVIYG